MNKNIIGDWGAGLSDRDYGMALAALGVLEATGSQSHRASSDPQQILAALNEELENGDHTAIWRGSYNITGETAKTWPETIHQDAQALAKGWQSLLNEARRDHSRKLPRLAVKAEWRRRPDLFDLDTLLGWLAADDTACQALVISPEDARPGECRTIWHWPLQVGVPAGAEGQQLWDALTLEKNESSWLEQLGLLRLVGEARDACDLLILPTGMAVRLAEQPRLRLRASFIVCLDEPVPGSAAPDTPQARLREKMEAAGVALVGTSLHPVELYYRLMRELSHDLPVHQAVWGACRYKLGLQYRPTIIGEPASLDCLRILAVGEQLDRKEEILLQSRIHVKKALLGGPEAPPRLSDQMRTWPFISEDQDGLHADRESTAKKRDLEEERQIRHIQAYAWRQDMEAKPAGALAPDRPSLLTVHIGPDAKPRPDPPFSEDQIDFSSGKVQLQVHLELAGANMAAIGREAEITSLCRSFPELPVAEMARLFQLLGPLIAAPKADIPGKPTVVLDCEAIELAVAGDSTRAFFAVWPKPGVQKVQGRIAIIYQNRILQTASLTSPVDLRGDAGPGITVAADPAVHPRLHELAERRQFDVALTADDSGGHLRLTIRRACKVQEVSLGNLKESLIEIRGILDRGAQRWDFSKPLEQQPALRPILYGLASNGCLLFKLFRSLQAELGEELLESQRIQLVCYGTAFFPLEYVYSGPPPQDTAEVCPIFQGKEGSGCQRLQPASGDEGKDNSGKDCPYAASENHLCPLHFWGFNKVIERHNLPAAIDHAAAQTVKDSRSYTVPSRQPFGPITSMLSAATAKAFSFIPEPKRKQEQQQFADALGSLGWSSNWASSWEEWKAGVEKNPNLLVLIVHAVKKPDELGITKIPMLEIGEGKTWPKHLIDEKIIGDLDKVQLLLLLGCSTAQVTEDFAPYHELFRYAGADVILATLSAIWDRDALAMARGITESLHQRLSAGQNIAFGELLRDLRRQLFAKGHPGVLGLVGFGDADWVMGG